MFQQELLDLLDTFNITEAADYHRLAPRDKPYFIKRLYKVFVSNTKEALYDIAHCGGVKFHFAASGNLNDSNPNVPSETFLKKLSFYANRTLITFPFQEIRNKKQLRILENKPIHEWKSRTGNRHLYAPMIFGDIVSMGRGAVGVPAKPSERVYNIDPDAFDDFLTIICQLRPVVHSGVVRILPLFPDFSKDLRSKKLRLTSANFQLKDLEEQFNEVIIAVPEAASRKKLGLTHLLLPHFSKVPLERILEIRTKEEDLYWELQRRLEQLLQGASQLESERKLLSFLWEVDQGVRELHRKFIELQEKYRRKEIYFLIKFISAALVLMAPFEAREAISGVLGSMSAFDYLTTRQEKAQEMYETRNNKFYLPWLVFRTQAD